MRFIEDARKDPSVAAASLSGEDISTALWAIVYASALEIKRMNDLIAERTP